MKELLTQIAQGLVNDPEAVSVVVDEPDEQNCEGYQNSYAFSRKPQ